MKKYLLASYFFLRSRECDDEKYMFPEYFFLRVRKSHAGHGKDFFYDSVKLMLVILGHEEFRKSIYFYDSWNLMMIKRILFPCAL